MSLFHQYPLQHFLLVGAILFAAGLYTVLTRKNAVSILMGVELILNAANVNFVAIETPKLQNRSFRIVQISDLHCDITSRLQQRDGIR